MSQTLTIETNLAGNQYLINNPVTIVRPLSGALPEYSVIAVLFEPFGYSNTVTFLDSWYEYASAVSGISNEEVLPLSIVTSVQLGKVYTFNGVEIIPSTRTCGNDEYGLENLRKGNNENVVCGLAEEIKVNGLTAFSSGNCVESLAVNNTVYFKPSNKIYVFTSKNLALNMVILSSYLQSETISSRVTVSRYLEVDISQSVTIHFNAETKLFEPGKLPTAQKTASFIPLNTN